METTRALHDCLCFDDVCYLKTRADKLLTQFLRYASIILVSTITLNVCSKQFYFLLHISKMAICDFVLQRLD